MIYSRISASFEHALNNKFSIGIAGFYSYPENIYSHIDYQGFKILPTFRYYPSEKGLQGFYLEPQLVYGRFRHEFKYESPEYYEEGIGYYTNEVRREKTFNTFGAVVHIGWQWIILDHLTIDLNAGLQYLPNPVAENINADGETYILDEKNPDKHLFEVPRDWYIAGPGSLINGNIAIGFAF